MALKIMHKLKHSLIAFITNIKSVSPNFFLLFFLTDFELSRNGSFEGCLCYHFGSVFRYGVYIYFNQSIERLGVHASQTIKNLVD